MTDLDRQLQALFRAVFDLAPSIPVTQCQQSNTPSWDSMAHVSLVAAIEGEFGLSIDAGDSLTLTSYDAVRQYLESQGV